MPGVIYDCKPFITLSTDFDCHSEHLTYIAYQNIARQSLRAFVASPDFETGIRKIEYILDNSDLTPTPKYIISCPLAKCFTPGTVASIELLGSVTVHKGIGGEAISGSEIVLAKVSERFDQWRED